MLIKIIKMILSSNKRDDMTETRLNQIDPSELYLMPVVPEMAQTLLPLMSTKICKGLAIDPIKTVNDMRRFISGTYSLQKWRFFIMHGTLGVIGGISFGLIGDKESKMTALLSYWVAEDYQGNGYGFVALSLLMEALKNQGVTHYLAQVYPYNIASQNILKKCGFVCLDPHMEQDNFTGLVDFTLILT